jgi:hypothetical protein
MSEETGILLGIIGTCCVGVYAASRTENVTKNIIFMSLIAANIVMAIFLWLLLTDCVKLGTLIAKNQMTTVLLTGFVAAQVVMFDLVKFGFAVLM